MRTEEEFVDVTGWSEERILAWESRHEQFATEERMNAAIAANEPTAEELAESERWRAFYDAEAGVEETA